MVYGRKNDQALWSRRLPSTLKYLSALITPPLYTVLIVFFCWSLAGCSDGERHLPAMFRSQAHVISVLGLRDRKLERLGCTQSRSPSLSYCSFAIQCSYRQLTAFPKTSGGPPPPLSPARRLSPAHGVAHYSPFSFRLNCTLLSMMAAQAMKFVSATRRQHRTL